MAIRNLDQPTQQPHSNQGQNHSQPGAWSFHSKQMLTAFSASAGSAVYNDLKSKLVKIFEDIENTHGLVCEVIDCARETEKALNFSCLIIAVYLRDMKEVGVAFHTLILEATGEKMAPHIDTSGNRYASNSQGNRGGIEVLRPTSIAYDGTLYETVSRRVSTVIPNMPHYFHCDSCVIPRGFNTEDIGAVRSIASMSILAGSRELQTRMPGFRDINLGTLSNEDSLEINVAFAPTYVTDETAMPIRSDLSVEFVSKLNNSKGNGYQANRCDTEKLISRLTGFIDLVYCGNQQQSVFQRMEMPTVQQYAPRCVITSLATPEFPTPGAIMFGLSTIFSLSENSNWAQVFRPTTARGKTVDIKDIGAVNYEANVFNSPPGTPLLVDTSTSGADAAAFGTYLGMLLRPNFALSIDCPDSGPQTHFLSLFANASRGDAGSMGIIYDALCELTNGKFAEFFPRGTPMFTDTGNRIHLGTWVNSSGQLCDIRDIDYVAVCSLWGKDDPSRIRAWGKTFEDVNKPIIMRLAERRAMISHLTGETAEFTDFAERVTFSGHLAKAFTAAMTAINVSVRTNIPTDNNVFLDTRGGSTFINDALVGNGRVFGNPSGQAYGVGDTYNPGFVSRYS